MRQRVTRRQAAGLCVLGFVGLLIPSGSLWAQTVASSVPIPVSLKSGYLKQHPRLLFGPEDKVALQAKAKTDPLLWKYVMWAGEGVLKPGPTPKDIRTGRGYTATVQMFSAALYYYVSGGEEYRDGVIKRMKEYAAVDVWGTGWSENRDIPCNWTMYYMALAYDILYDEIPEPDRQIIIKSIREHGKVVYDYWKDHNEAAPFDQNHTYVPLAALGAAALAFYKDIPEAPEWLALSNDIMDKSIQVLTTDGYYYEGTAYWEYAFHWYMRWADLMLRATGRNLFDNAMFRQNHLQALHASLPGAPYFFDVGDTGSGAPGRASPQEPSLGWQFIVARLASALQSPEAQGVFHMLRERGKRSHEPAMEFLWYDPDLKAGDVRNQEPYHYFKDMDIVFWRSSWEPDATICMFKAGPPLGHSAAKMLERLPGWTPNTGHVHPDMGAIWLFGRGNYLLTDTGYTAKKRTRDHNTFLVDGMGIGEDFTYWVYRGEGRERACNAKWDKVRLTKVHLEKTYGYALGDLSSAYPDELGRITLLRHVIMTRDVVVLLDEFDGEKPHVFTSVLHTDEIMQKQADGVWKLSLKDGGMMAYVLSPGETKVEAAEAIVFGGKGPGGGADVQRGYQLTIGTPKPVAAGTYVTVLTPLGSDQAVPRAVRCEALDKKAMTLLIDWGARTETIRLDMRWKPGEAAGPVTIR